MTDNVVKQAIGVLCFCATKNEIVSGKNTCASYQAELLSYLSWLNAKFSVFVNNLAELQKEIVVDNFSKKHVCLNQEKAQDIKVLLDSVTLDVDKVKDSLCLEFNISPTELSSFEETPTETLLDLQKYASYSVSKFLYERTNLSSAIKGFQTYPSQIEAIQTSQASEKNTFINKGVSVLKKAFEPIKSLTEVCRNTDDLLEGYRVAYDVFNDKNFSEAQREEFLSRTYNEIKADIIQYS